MATGKETRVSSQSGAQVKPMKAPKSTIDSAMRASKPGKPYTGAPGHSLPR